MDMRAGTETALARVIAVFGAAKPHCAYEPDPVGAHEWA
ncbi:IS66 family insertion sequence element accessory protein TnpB [Pseudomonas putida]|nr:IS66 family insertion sequence element accessory protein TnpB [Pseudomonas putida]